MEQEKICGECKYHMKQTFGPHKGEWFCINGSSDYWFDWTDYSDSCEEWEGRNEP